MDTVNIELSKVIGHKESFGRDSTSFVVDTENLEVLLVLFWLTGPTG